MKKSKETHPMIGRKVLFKDGHETIGGVIIDREARDGSIFYLIAKVPSNTTTVVHMSFIEKIEPIQHPKVPKPRLLSKSLY